MSADRSFCIAYTSLNLERRFSAGKIQNLLVPSKGNNVRIFLPLVLFNQLLLSLIDELLLSLIDEQYEQKGSFDICKHSG